MLCNFGLAAMLGAERMRELFGRRRLKAGDQFVMTVTPSDVAVIERAGEEGRTDE